MLKFAEQIFVMEPISIIFVEFNFALKGKNCENKICKNVYPYDRK